MNMKYVHTLRRVMFAGLLLAGLSATALEKCETPLPPGWIECEGIGLTEEKAIDKALKQGISMVFGVEMSASDELLSASEVKDYQTPTGDQHVEFSKEFSESQMMKKTQGRVRAFSIIWVKPDKDPSFVKAHLHANIVNPRAGLDGVILVAPPQAEQSIRENLFDVGPHKKLAGSEICEAVEKAICTALSNSKHYRTLTYKDMKSTYDSAKLSEKMVEAGLSPTTELLEAGKALTADYILTMKLKDFVYSRKLGRDKKTKKMGAVYKMKVVLDVHLTNVRLGTMVASNTLTLTLSSAEIKTIVDEDENADLLVPIFNQMITPLRGWIKANAK